MATITNVLAGTSKYATATYRETQSQIKALQQDSKDIYKDSSLTAEEKGEKAKENSAAIKLLQDGLKTTDIGIDSTAVSSLTGLFASLGTSGSGGGGISALTAQRSDGFGMLDTILGMGGSLSEVRTMGSATRRLERDALTLSARISYDESMGKDVTADREKLGNIAGNLSVLNKNSQSKIDSALGKTAEDTEETAATAAAKKVTYVNYADYLKADRDFAAESDKTGGHAPAETAASDT